MTHFVMNTEFFPSTAALKSHSPLIHTITNGVLHQRKWLTPEQILLLRGSTDLMALLRNLMPMIANIILSASPHVFW